LKKRRSGKKRGNFPEGRFLSQKRKSGDGTNCAWGQRKGEGPLPISANREAKVVETERSKNARSFGVNRNL